MVGACGLRPTLAAVAAGKVVALANKEVLVSAGHLVMQAVKMHGATLLPIDSEHAAIHQCLRSSQTPRQEIRRILITGSGGPFRDTPMQQLPHVNPTQALKHPNWVMGDKISIDSATLMNKGLEMIEAHHLFGIDASQIEVWSHRQSIVHSLVEFVDGSVIAQLGLPDMRLPLQYCMSYPQRLPGDWPRLQLSDLSQMTFESPDHERFPCLKLAYSALEKGGSAPAVLNAANEAAVSQFLAGQIAFTAIPQLIAKALAQVPWVAQPSLADILAVDAEARERLGVPGE
jgi:1-deoxy-D-xylulose-5-phosphate reductoisomerase